MDKQARQLASLTSEVSARDRLINRRLQHIEQLEKQVGFHFRHYRFRSQREVDFIKLIIYIV